MGHLYQGRYKAILIEQDSYLLDLSRYVHVNPIRVRRYGREESQKQTTFLKSYPWSSLSGYLSSQKTLPWVNYDAVLSYVGGSRKRYGEFLAEGIRKGYDTPWERVQGQVVLGQDDFVERVKNNVSSKSSKREQPAMRHLARRDLMTIVYMVADYFRVPQDKLTGRRTGHRDERAIALELMYCHGAVSQARIGKLFGLDYTAVSRERKRLRERTESNKSLRKQLREIEVSVLS